VSETTTQGEAITTDRAGRWLDAFVKYAAPAIVVLIGAVVGWQTLRNDLINVRENSARDAARIETLRTDYQTHQNAITKLEANAQAMNSRLDVMVATIDRRFDALDKRMDTLSSTMQALIMALNERRDK
jgi:hypothetical protein